MSATLPYRIDTAKRMHRFYRMEVQPDLFGRWCLIREWGRIGSIPDEANRPAP
jgi:predicted DNA-binding WGR domain protein